MLARKLNGVSFMTGSGLMSGVNPLGSMLCLKGLGTLLPAPKGLLAAAARAEPLKEKGFCCWADDVKGVEGTGGGRGGAEAAGVAAEEATGLVNGFDPASGRSAQECMRED